LDAAPHSQVNLRHRKQTGGVLTYGTPTCHPTALKKSDKMSAEQSNYGAFALLMSNTFAPYLSNRFTVHHVRVLCIDRHMFLRPQPAPHRELGLKFYFYVVKCFFGLSPYPIWNLA